MSPFWQWENEKLNTIHLISVALWFVFEKALVDFEMQCALV
jgi:hypothetical protein